MKEDTRHEKYKRFRGTLGILAFGAALRKEKARQTLPAFRVKVRRGPVRRRNDLVLLLRNLSYLAGKADGGVTTIER